MISFELISVQGQNKISFLFKAVAEVDKSKVSPGSFPSHSSPGTRSPSPRGAIPASSPPLLLQRTRCRRRPHEIQCPPVLLFGGSVQSCLTKSIKVGETVFCRAHLKSLHGIPEEAAHLPELGLGSSEPGKDIPHRRREPGWLHQARRANSGSMVKGGGRSPEKERLKF